MYNLKQTFPTSFKFLECLELLHRLCTLADRRPKFHMYDPKTFIIDGNSMNTSIFWRLSWLKCVIWPFYRIILSVHLAAP